MCYDSAGNTLVENKASFKNHGYPVDVSISDSGELLMVSYAQVENNMIQSRVVFYNFGKAGQDKQDHIVETYSYENQLVPSVFRHDTFWGQRNFFNLFRSMDLPFQSGFSDYKNVISTAICDCRRLLSYF